MTAGGAAGVARFPEVRRASALRACLPGGLESSGWRDPSGQWEVRDPKGCGMGPGGWCGWVALKVPLLEQKEALGRGWEGRGEGGCGEAGGSVPGGIPGASGWGAQETRWCRGRSEL